ncbi:protein of unknown function DUF732 [Mycolicibacterium rhodesiae JS60]|nr:protein of unknown function DUF732 [Mycolicibacterium rhodesiae JS60]
MRMSTRMIGCTVVGVALTLFGAPAAHADNESFVSTAKALGFQQNSENLISTGRSACYFLSRNRDPGQVTERIARYTSVNLDLAHQFLALSVNEYCPQYDQRIGV